GGQQAGLSSDDLQRAQPRHPDLGESRVLQALLNDLNTPEALSQLGRSIDRLAGEQDRARQARLKALVLQEAWLLGLLQQTPLGWFQAGFGEEEKKAIEALIAERNAA